jgi:hypothetical protein
VNNFEITYEIPLASQKMEITLLLAKISAIKMGIKVMSLNYVTDACQAHSVTNPWYLNTATSDGSLKADSSCNSYAKLLEAAIL